MDRVHNGNILITGGAGFIGTNLALSYLEQSQPVHILDSLARPGVEKNIEELLARYPGLVRFTEADVRQHDDVERAVHGATAVYHLAAQVAVTTSLDEPVTDLETNLMGTINVLEAIRNTRATIPLLFTSTNKVYGRLSRIVLRPRGNRYEPESESTARMGASEEEPLEFLSPYGCSKGSADQYVLDYAHSYGIRATVFRMSCIYGPYQMGSEDQGWVAHFLRQAMKEEPITIYGDGRQVRDLLFVADLVRAMLSAMKHIPRTAGKVFNMGGGSANSTSLLELVDLMQGVIGNRIKIHWAPERLADQRWYVADTSRFRAMLNWAPAVSIRDGLRSLHTWFSDRLSSRPRSAVQVA
jgi:CDP-paratose 2-epimerase